MTLGTDLLTEDERQEIERHLQRDPDADRALLEDAIRRRRGRDHPEAERIREDRRAALGEPEAIKAKLQRLRDNPPPAPTRDDDRPEPEPPPATPPAELEQAATVLAHAARARHGDSGAEPTAWDLRRHGVMPRTTAGKSGGTRPLVVVSADVRQLPLGLVGTDRFQTEPASETLPGIEPLRPSPVPVLPLVMPYEAAGGSSMTRGRGAALPLRLFVEVLMAVPPELRRTDNAPPTSVTCKLRQLAAALWPRGWQRGRDWPKLAAGLGELSRLGVEWELPSGQGGVWIPVTVRSFPRAGAMLDDVCRFEVLLPPGSGSGPLVDRTHTRLLGLDSAPAFRLYLALCWYWDHHDTVAGRLIGPTVPEVRRNAEGYVLDARGEVVTERGGRPSRRATHPRAVQIGGRAPNPAADRFPALSPDDLAVMAYSPRDLAKPKTSTRRTQRQRAGEALDLIATMTDTLVLPATRSDGVAGCVRVLPSPAHKAAHDASFELRRTARPT